MSHHRKTMIWGGGYFLRSFWYKIHLPPNRFYSTKIGISQLLFPIFIPKKNSLGRTIFLRDSGMFSRGRDIITFWWFSNLRFNWIYFYQFGSSTKITQYTLTCKELANPMVPLIIPKFDFLTKKQHLKVKNHHFLMGFSVCRARTILLSPCWSDLRVPMVTLSCRTLEHLKRSWKLPSEEK